MNFESFNFTLISAIMGMGIVFLFLGLLYFLMSLLSIKPKRVLRRILKKNNYKKMEYKNNKISNAKENHEDKTIDWIIAAVSAYLETENQQTTPTAMPWIRDRKNGYNLWVGINKIKGDNIY